MLALLAALTFNLFAHETPRVFSSAEAAPNVESVTVGVVEEVRRNFPTLWHP